MSDIKQVIVVRKDLNMRKGKLAAQVAHATMMFMTRNLVGPFFDESGTAHHELLLDPVQQRWMDENHGLSYYKKVVVSVDSEAELLELVQKARDAGVVVHKVIDSGLTEFHGQHTLTCACFGPDESSRIDPITGHLKLL